MIENIKDDSGMWQYNPYYNPEKCGLEIIKVEGGYHDYEYDTEVWFRDVESNAIYYAHDSGCSCPIPFENFKSLNDMTKLTLIEKLRFKNRKQ